VLSQQGLGGQSPQTLKCSSLPEHHLHCFLCTTLYHCLLRLTTGWRGRAALLSQQGLAGRWLRALSVLCQCLPELPSLLTVHCALPIPAKAKYNLRLQGGAAVLSLQGAVRIEPIVAQGCRPLTDSTWLVDKCENNIIMQVGASMFSPCRPPCCFLLLLLLVFCCFLFVSSSVFLQIPLHQLALLHTLPHSSTRLLCVIELQGKSMQSLLGLMPPLVCAPTAGTTMPSQPWCCVVRTCVRAYVHTCMCA